MISRTKVSLNLFKREDYASTSTVAEESR